MGVGILSVLLDFLLVLYYNFMKLLNYSMGFEKNTIKELGVSQKESFTEKKENLDLFGDILQEHFGKEKLPKDLVLEMVNIRKEIKNEIERENFVDNLDEVADGRIKLLMTKIYNPELNSEEIEEIIENKNGDLEINLKNGEK